MTPDHIPSFAALKKYLENKLGRKLRPHEITQYYNDATTILYETSLHQKYSRTYGGRNTAEQIAEDAQDLTGWLTLFPISKYHLNSTILP